MPTINHTRFSFVRFGSDDYILPAYGTFDAAFQFLVSGTYGPQDPLKLGITKVDGTLIDNPLGADYYATQIRHKLSFSTPYLNAPATPFLIAITSGSTTKAYGNIFSYDDFLNAMFDDFGYRSLSNTEFLDNGTQQDVILTFYDDTKPAGQQTIQVGSTPGSGQWYAQFPGTPISPTLKVGSCFRYCIIDKDGNIAGKSNVFKVIADPKYTSLLTYSNPTDFAEFVYPANSVRANVVRLPMYLSKPVYPETYKSYVASNGVHRLESAFIEKQYEVNTAVFPETFHDCLKMALRHRSITVNDSRLGKTVKLVGNDSYGPEWTDKGTTAKGKGTFLIADFGYTNSNYE